MKTAILLSIGILLPLYSINGTIPTFIDNKTQLEWQITPSFNEYNQIAEMNWEDAIKQCEALIINNQEDWRLPNINELESIVDRTKFQPSVKSPFNDSILSNKYWSSSSSRTGVFIWYMDLETGVREGSQRYTSIKLKYTLCVRSNNEE